MKKSLLCLLMALLCGCSSLPVEVSGNRSEVKELVLAVPRNSDELLHEVARELARRAEDFAENKLSVVIVESRNIWTDLKDGQVDLLICGNDQLVSAAGSDDVPLFAMMEEPYFFREGDCVINGGNHEDILAALNYSLGEEFSMKLNRISYMDSYDLLCSNVEELESALQELSVDELLQQYAPEGETPSQDWKQLLNAYGLQETELGMEEIPEGGGVLFSGHRQKLLEIFISPDSLELLSEKEQAAIEEAIVYSAGYCRTLADSQKKAAKQIIETDNVPIVKIDLDDWYDALQKKYQSDSNDIKRQFARLLEDKVERYH